MPDDRATRGGGPAECRCLLASPNDLWCADLKGEFLFLIGDQGLLLLAVDDVLVDGQRLEVVSVAPTIEVAFDPRYAAGSDPQLERAVQILSRV
jgi:hypothetical protein